MQRPIPGSVPSPEYALIATPRLITQGFDAGNNPGQGFYSGTGITPAGLFDPVATGAGSFTLKYRYLTTAGCTDSTTGNITVWPRPTANFDVSAITCINSAITLTNTSVANANSITTWNWDYGNGTEIRTNGNPFTRIYTIAQTYNISLRVTTDSGCNSVPLTKAVPVYPTPVVDFDLPALVCLPKGTAAFTNKTTVGGTGGTPITYLWNFGVAGATSTDVNPVYNYSNTGSYTIRLNATSARGCVDSASKVLPNVHPQPLADFLTTPGEVCLAAPIQFYRSKQFARQ